MKRWLLPLIVIVTPRAAAAQVPGPILIEVSQEAPRETDLVDAVDRASRAGALKGSALSAAIGERISAPAQESDRSGLEDLMTLVQEGIHDFYQNRFEQAIEELGRSSSALRDLIDVVGRDERFSSALFDAQIILAITLRHERRPDEAREVVRHCLRTFPNRRPQLAQFSPDIIRFFDETKNGMDAEPLAQLKVTTQPSGCEVLRNGQTVGASPWEGPTYPGALTLQVRCGGQLSGVRRLTIAAGPREIPIDFEADAALHAGPIPWISAGPAAQRAAAALGHQLGRNEVVLVQGKAGRVEIETLRSGNPRVERRGEGRDAQAAWASLRAVPRSVPRPTGPPPPPPPPSLERAPWYHDVGAWTGIGIGAATLISGIAIVGSAREDARQAVGELDPQRSFELSQSARNNGLPGVFLVTGGAALALGGLAALATPASTSDRPFRGPLFWVMATAGALTTSIGVALLLTSGCDYDDHSLCPAVLESPLQSSAPAGLILTTTGAILLATSLILRLTEPSDPSPPRTQAQPEPETEGSP